MRLLKRGAGLCPHWDCLDRAVDAHGDSPSRWLAVVLASDEREDRAGV
jgi:hypothetical protein